jgi:hypothetical protein
MCKLFLALAFSYHISLIETYKMNVIHPNAGMECQRYEAGVFYNSESEVSVYAGRKFPVTQKSYMELGLVSGYVAYDVLPYIRYVHGNFFMFPTVYTHPYETYTNGVYAVERRPYPMVVVGLNFKK